MEKTFSVTERELTKIFIYWINEYNLNGGVEFETIEERAAIQAEYLVYCINNPEVYNKDK